ncbi:hypothetical protein JCGZ_26369 [Jatropha curcas]|uniref:Myb-like domain-containing protein n=1 Tax=Jatropha curcas TaxID=180498 RepID=A0A067JI81_JATCU|nr:trihelix transcription factor ASR3 [Jatropha curcas]KDP22538.1 hypothetical protein JCGZ_26369 [Jatropha curcas]
MAPDSVDAQQLTSLSDKIQQQAFDNGLKATRHPRWSKEETFILIKGKKVVENRVYRSCRSSSTLGLDQIEPKWDSVSSYCKQHAVNRGPEQCRKRWSNLLCDFKKIKNWELHRKDEDETFWKMRNELRRERRLPGFFDREVYNLLDGRPFATEAIPLRLITVETEMKNAYGDEVAARLTAAEKEEDEEATVDGLFSDYKELEQDEICWTSKKETVVAEDPRRTQPTSGNSISSTIKEQNPGTLISQKGWKKRPLSSYECEDTNLTDRLIKVFERNGNLLSAQLEARNINLELDRHERKEQNASLVGVLQKLTDGLIRIAEKL